MAFSYGWRGPNITKSGLVFYIDPGSPNSFFNKSGVTVKDISSISSTNTATLVNGPTYKTTNGGVITLDGSNDYCSTTFIGTFTSMTIQAWFFRNGNQPSWFAGLVMTRGGSGGNTSGLSLNHNGNESLGYNWNDQANTYSWNSGLVLTNQGWNFLSLVIAPTYATGFLNGTSSTNSVTHTFASNFRNVAIGKDYITERYVRGDIGPVLIYDRALTSDEVLQNYNSTKTRFGL